LLVSSTSETNECETSKILSSDRFYDIDSNTIAGDRDDLSRNDSHPEKDNAHNVFFIDTTTSSSFLPIKDFQRTTYSAFTNTK
jgi:hypothetical protein